MPYGAVIAARMNAELGTNYDVEKLLTWCFDITPLRNWGATLGNWGGYDCDGLIGEALYDGYAFSMNGFQHVAALAPLVRYDERFSRAIGKWILNVANASRLFYPNYLPPENQDSETWSYEYDPGSYIAHESMREDWMGISPYATGDAISGGWGATNLSLYSSSHVGYLAAVVDTTNVTGILQIDVLATDWYHQDAYPTYLYYNSYDIPMVVDLPLPPGSHDIYDLISNQILLNAVSGTAQINIMEDNALLVAIVPVGGSQTYDYDKLLIDGVVVDFNSESGADHPPRIKAFGTPTPVVEASSVMNFFCEAEDREDGNDLSYSWYLNGNQLAATGPSLQFTTPADTGMYSMSCTVLDNGGLESSAEFTFHVVAHINYDPVIESLVAVPVFVVPGGSATITCTAHDDDDLDYAWSSPDGGTLSGTGSVVTWTAPQEPGVFNISCLVTDPYAASDSAATTITVTDSTGSGFGNPILYLPFSGNVNDHSGYGNHGVLSGAGYVDDRAGNSNAALHFDGSDDRVQVANNTALNFGDAISVSLWINVEEFFGREAYPISHGNWENRWKISITNGRVRWTVKTNAGIRDLDSATELVADTYYHVVALYDGSNFDIYLNGVLDQHTTHSGEIQQTSHDLTIAQVLPGNPGYNFKGIIDDVRLYDYAIDAETVTALYQEPVRIGDEGNDFGPEAFYFAPCYPNPFNPSTTISYTLDEAVRVQLTVHDISGRQVAQILDTRQRSGMHTLEWRALDENGQSLETGVYLCRLRAGAQIRTIKMVILK